MNRRIAIPVVDEVLSAHFGQCEAFAYIDVEDDKIVSIVYLDPPEHLPGTYPRWVSANGATTVIAGGMGQQAINLFNGFGIDVFVGAPILEPKTLVSMFLNGQLTLDANYCNHDDHDHHHHHHH